MENINIPAQLENLYETLNWINAKMEAAGFNERARDKVMLASEEIFVNIANYAYDGVDGLVTVGFTLSDDSSALVEFQDAGTPFNPLSRPDPDLSASVEQRGIGGLGIFLAKNLMDSVEYRFEDGRNILCMEKKRGGL